MSTPASLPLGVDPARPSPARVYDYLLGGEHHFASDRAAADMLISRAPELAASARANRAYHQRAARWMAGRGVSQFLDLGSGLPGAGSTHEVVREVRPGARVVYVDNDPMVLALGQDLLAVDDEAAVVIADVRDPRAVLTDPALRSVIDFGEPVGVLLSAVLHFVADESDPAALVAAYAAPLAAGSYVALSHMTADDRPAEGVQALIEVGRRAAGGTYLRSRAEVRALFGDLELVPPGAGVASDITWVGEWNSPDQAAEADPADVDGGRWLYGGVARKTS
jgi:hypothetical protein